MLDTKALLGKLTRALGSEPLSVYGSSLVENQQYQYISYQQRVGRIACGMSSTGNTCWVVNYVSPNSTTYKYGIFWIEVFASSAPYTGKTTSGTSGGTYYGYTDYTDMTTAEQEFGTLLNTSPQSLIGGISDGTYTRLLRGAWGTYVSNTATAQINAQICTSNSVVIRYTTHNRSTEQTSSNQYGTYMYGVALWGKST